MKDILQKFENKLVLPKLNIKTECSLLDPSLFKKMLFKHIGKGIVEKLGQIPEAMNLTEVLTANSIGFLFSMQSVFVNFAITVIAMVEPVSVNWDSCYPLNVTSYQPIPQITCVVPVQFNLDNMVISSKHPKISNNFAFPYNIFITHSVDLLMKT